jgi:branched-subunit amino acid transport protein
LAETDLLTLVAIIGMAGATLLTRCFFFISDREWAMPGWAERGLRYTPIAALTAVIGPEIILTQGAWPVVPVDAKWVGALAGVLWFRCKRGSPHAVLGTIVIGMAVYLPLHLILGW